MSDLNLQSQAFLDRVRVGVSSNYDLSRLSGWLEQNTKHPKDNTLPWVFTDHEFQEGIVNDPASRVICRKCSQVGLSEVTVRLTLAMLGTLRNHTAIYTLPTSGFASSFAKSRFDPVIETSPVLSELIDKDTDSSTLKKLGTSFLYILGTFTQKAAISIPADIMINDEVDFSNQQALTTFASRLGHAKDGGIRREFSTPTVRGYGVSKSFDLSSQAYYHVNCDHCHEWVSPQFLDDVVIPGYEDKLVEFEAEDLHDHRYKIDEAYVSCPNCRGKLTIENLADPEKRQWIHLNPDRPVRGYQVYPYDVPLINPPSRTINQIADYSRKADWINFKVGEPFEDAESSFLDSIIDNSTVLRAVMPAEAAASGCVMGIDVGKTSWVIVGKRTSRVQMDILYLERIRQDGEGTLLARILELIEYFGVKKAVIDAGPDFTTSMALVEKCRMGMAWANYYVRTKSRNTLSHISLNEEEGISNTVRTESIDLLAKMVNAGRVKFPKMSETAVLKDHLRNIKRVEQQNNAGELVANWVSNGDDHYAHALNYLNIADTLLDSRFAKETVIGVLPMATKVPLKTVA